MTGLCVIASGRRIFTEKRNIDKHALFLAHCDWDTQCDGWWAELINLMSLPQNISIHHHQCAVLQTSRGGMSGIPSLRSHHSQRTPPLFWGNLTNNLNSSAQYCIYTWLQTCHDHFLMETCIECNGFLCRQSSPTCTVEVSCSFSTCSATSSMTLLRRSDKRTKRRVVPGRRNKTRKLPQMLLPANRGRESNLSFR